MDHVLSGPHHCVTMTKVQNHRRVSHVMAEIKRGPLQYSCLESILAMNSMKRQKDRTLKDELPRSVGVQYVTGDQWRNNSRKNEGTEPKQNNTQLWMCLVIEAKSDAVKSNIDRNLEC